MLLRSMLYQRLDTTILIYNYSILLLKNEIDGRSIFSFDSECNRSTPIEKYKQYRIEIDRSRVEIELE